MFESKNLSVLSYANGFTLWHYTTPETAEAAKADGYFNAAADMLRAGDVIVANCDTGRPNRAGAALLHVKAAAPGQIVTASV